MPSLHQCGSILEMRDFLDQLSSFREFLLESGAAQSTLAVPTPRMSIPAEEDGAHPQSWFVALVTEHEIVGVSRDLFASGHYSLAVQEACKALEKYLQEKTSNNASGSSLMDQIFSPNRPSLFWTDRSTASERDEQVGYHRIYSGVMMGIRNPTTHEFNWVDDAEKALEIICLVQHLLRKAKIARVSTHERP